MKKAWPVSVGSYSDYTVIAVCATEEIAQQLADTFNEHKHTYSDPYTVDYPIEMYEVGDPMPTRVTVWQSTIYNDGRVVTESAEKFPHQITMGGGHSYYGAHAYGYPTAEEAEQAARAWRELPQR